MSHCKSMIILDSKIGQKGLSIQHLKVRDIRYVFFLDYVFL